jgi:hypothetical protein
MMKKYKIYQIGLGVLALFFLTLGLIIYFNNKTSTAVPKYILSEVNFPIFYPSGLKNTTIQSSSFKYDNGQKYTSYIVTYDKFKLTFSEQDSPNTFSADPSIINEFMQKFNVYSSFSSIYGTVNLTQPKNTPYETAIMNSTGTLMFVRSDNGYISESNWRLLFNNLSYVRPN